LGQKVNPLGFRVGITQKSKSNWFSKFDLYKELLKEDNIIRQFLETKDIKAGISKIEINRNSSGNKIQIIIVSCRPEKLLSNNRKIPQLKLKEIYESLEKIISHKRMIILKINIIKNCNTDATFIANFIVEQLEKRVTFIRALKKALEKVTLAKVPGIKIQISGRLNGADMARTKWIRKGRVPLQTLRANIDYTQKEANTIHGIIGIKVWLFKGEILNNFK
jgi:small subunit ribosomal protein S3